MTNRFFHVWRAPIILAIVTIFGLLAALLGTGGWHVASWIALVVPIVVCIRFGVFFKK